MVDRDTAAGSLHWWQQAISRYPGPGEWEQQLERARQEMPGYKGIRWDGIDKSNISTK